MLAVVIPPPPSSVILRSAATNAMDPAFLEAVQNQQRQTQGHSQSDMMAAIERLQKRLKGDARRRLDLVHARAHALQRGSLAEALDAFREVDRLVPNNADIIADMADMTAAANSTR